MRRKLVFAAIAAVSLILPGCLLVLLAPPFDATGTYEGTWVGTVSGLEREYTCAVKLDLDHEVGSGLNAGYTITGTLRLNFTCTATIHDLVPLGFPAFLDFNVTGFLNGSGEVIFLSAECNDLDCDSVVLTATGDDDGSAFAQHFEGSFASQVTVEGAARTLSGTFEVDRMP